ncbi:MAG: hydantoinase/oxoprolinase family protein [Eubacteriales bacterium]|jgi:N-methylhydantoinase A/oxoprolinase/acetone carboxylase beta subunit
MKIGIGIDTGGTCTDAILYDFEAGKVLASAKALTTKQDLSIGILGALDQLPVELTRQAGVLSLSTTLATNACVEDKGGRAHLVFFGGDPRVIDQSGAKYGLPASDEIYLQDCRTSFFGDVEQEPDWELFRKNIPQLTDVDGVGIIELYSMKNNAVIEKKAKEIFQQESDIPVVCGYELFSDLNCLQRGASTLLNARLFPVIQDFLQAIDTAMEQRDLHPSIVIMRSDGSLMSQKFASVRPVETLLCGPAASVVGGARLAQEPNSVVVDMGGTTTDLALIRDDMPVMAEDGVHVGRWKTYVSGLYVKTFGLGGDTAIHYDGKQLLLEPYRVVPICVAASQYPSVLSNLKRLLADCHPHSQFLHEHYLLVRDISGNDRYTAEEQAFCQALAQGPLPRREAAEAVGKDVYTLQVDRLLREGVVQLCGLTPTDIMHIRGDYTAYNVQASQLAAEFVAMNVEVTIPKLCEMVYDEVQRKIYRNVVEVLLENQDPYYKLHGVSEEVERFIDESYRLASGQQAQPLLSMPFRTDFALVGIGAPIGVFLPKVAQLLGTRAVIPEYHHVANALGAIMGNVCADSSVEIRPQYTPKGIAGYMVYGHTRNQEFEALAEAEQFALEEAKLAAQQEAERRGARGEITVTAQLQQHAVDTKDSPIYLGTRAVAHAMGSIGF